MQNTSSKITFISHRSTDKDIADMLLDFFASLNVEKSFAFCSSLPGNDIKHKISQEIKEALQKSVINIVILSHEYYQSAYCLNEAGIIWFQENPVLVIALPEIQPNTMLGFLNDEYKIRCLDNESDIAAIYDQVTDALSINKASATPLTYEIRKLKDRYTLYLTNSTSVETTDTPDEKYLTDDERIVLYYIGLRKIRKVKDSDIKQWVTENELQNVNVDNAFDLLASGGRGRLTAEDDSNVFEMEDSHFRTLLKDKNKIMDTLKVSVYQHCYLSKDRFKTMWQEKSFDDSGLLFIAYIRDENISSFGDRWMANQQIEDIKKWEAKHSLTGTLSTNYEKCLYQFIGNDLVYESSWTSYGNPREFSLHKSIKRFILGNDFPYEDLLDSIKEKNSLELPFL